MGANSSSVSSRQREFTHFALIQLNYQVKGYVGLSGCHGTVFRRFKHGRSSICLNRQGNPLTPFIPAHCQVAKVQNICRIRDIPNKERRLAELSLFKNQPTEAENILLSRNAVYKALTMWIELFKWEKALGLAEKSGHTDIVLYLREEYLKAGGMKEANQKFIEAARKVHFLIMIT